MSRKSASPASDSNLCPCYQGIRRTSLCPLRCWLPLTVLDTIGPYPVSTYMHQISFDKGFRVHHVEKERQFRRLVGQRDQSTPPAVLPTGVPRS